MEIAPLKKRNVSDFPWEGSCAKKPWEYKATAMIPVLDTYEELKTCVDLLRLQTERPYIIVVDTGSSTDILNQISRLRNSDLEVHSIRTNGAMHPSDFPAWAMDLSFSLCRTEFAFATHADCFARRRDLIEYMLKLCRSKSPVVGYEISPRLHNDWEGMVSHTATMYHMPTMDKIGFGWSLRRLANMYDLRNYKPDPMRPNWPDTEILGNYILRKFKISPYLIGSEQNFERNKDDNIDHCRSITSGKLYSPEYEAKATGWLSEAISEAKERIELWESERKRSILDLAREHEIDLSKIKDQRDLVDVMTGKRMVEE